MSIRPTFRYLVVLKTVVEERNVTKSAALLNSSQPSLSRTIRELEQIIGRPVIISVAWRKASQNPVLSSFLREVQPPAGQI